MYDAKPLADTVRWYGLNGTLGKLKFPEASVVAERSKPLTGLCMVTAALATTAPDGSVTVPVTFEEFPLCAGLAGAPASTGKTKNRDTTNLLRNFTMCFSFMNCGP